tara:strand:- start:59 stop:1063 length:1005 start_codon:yes stop_codon:yes gene_type:complete
MINFPIDIVYTWVDGNDESWRIKKNNTLKKYSNFHHTDEVSGNERFFDRNELKYSLRSVSKFAPWVRKIFIITDGQQPNWLNINNAKIQIIDHKEIFCNQSLLPCFNSHAIEANIHHIKDLSDNFLYFNDDCFLGRSTLKSDFFLDFNKPKLFMGKKTKNPLNKKYLLRDNPHQHAIFNSRKLVYKKLNTIINVSPRHGIKALNKESLYKTENTFKYDINLTIKNQFRDNSDIWMIALNAFELIAKNKNISIYLKPYRKKFMRYQLKIFRKNRDYVFIPLNLTTDRIKNKLDTIKKYKPLMFCINDCPNTEIEKYNQISKFLSLFYESKSEFEK